MKTNSSILYLFILFACAILSPVFGSPAPTCDVGEACVELRDDAKGPALQPDAQKTIDYIKAHADEINKIPLCFYSGVTTIDKKRVNALDRIHLDKTGKTVTLEKVIGTTVHILSQIIKQIGIEDTSAWKETPDWDETSRTLAEYASGPVYLLLGKDIRANSVYTRVEKTTLGDNKKIQLHTYELQTDGSITLQA